MNQITLLLTRREDVMRVRGQEAETNGKAMAVLQEVSGQLLHPSMQRRRSWGQRVRGRLVSLFSYLPTPHFHIS